MIKYIIISLLLISSSLGFAQTAQVTSTGNLIDPNAWSGVIYMTPQQLSQVEGTGGGPIPAYNTGTNTIRFSFLPYTATQVQAINSAMFNNNTNIQVSGYNYSWRLYGNNGFLSVTGKLFDTNGSVLEQAKYNYQFSPAMPMNFDLVSGSSNFSTPYNFKTLGAFEVSATGSDSLFWSGYYGPRLRDVNVSFNYSILPAASTPTVPTTTTNTSTPTATQIAETFSKPPADLEPQQQQQQQPQQQQQQMASMGSPPPPGSEPSPNNPPPSNNPAPQQNNPSPVGNPQPNEVVRLADISPAANRPREERSQGPATPSNTPQASQTTQKETTTASSSTKSESASGPSLNNVLAMIQTNQNRERSIAQNAVSQANEVAQSAVAQTEQTALSVAATSSAQSIQIATNAVTTGNNQEQKKTNTNFENVSEKNSAIASIDVRPNISAGFSLQVGARDTQNIINPTNRLNNETSTVAGMLGLTPSSTIQNMGQGLSINTNTQGATVMANTQVNEVVAVNYNTLLQSNRSVLPESNIQLGSSFFTRQGDPFQDYVQRNNISLSNEVREIRPTNVNRNAQDSEVAGNIRIERLGIVPVGFNAYTSFMLTNIAFYEPKEIYKNVVIKDNVRTMYFIEKGNTDTFNKMIEAQYK